MSKIGDLLEHPSRARQSIFFVAIALIPTLYGGLLTSANLDPLKHLDDVGAVVVNEDVPATGPDGTTISLGDAVVEELVGHHQTGSLTWTVASAHEAQSLLESGAAYVAVLLPENLSSAAASQGQEDAAAAKVTVRSNDAASMIMASVASRAGGDVVASISTQITNTLLAQTIEGVTDVHDSVEQAALGASELSAGSTDVEQGAAALLEGLSELQGGSASLQEGTETLSSGATSLDSGAHRLSDAMAALKATLASSSASSQSLATGATGASTGATNVASATSALDDQLNALTSQWASLSDDERQAMVESITVQADGLVAATNSLASSSAGVAAGVTTLTSSVGQVGIAVDQLSTASSELTSGADALTAGAAQVAAGSGELAGGLDAATSGASDLAEGTGQLASGGATLAASLAEGADQIPQFANVEIDRIAAAGAEPVTLSVDRLNQVDNYGEGLAPYFLSLALWVGAIAFYFVANPLHRGSHGTWATGIRSFGPGAAMAAAQSTALILMTHHILGMHAANTWGLIAIAALSSLTFVAIIQAFVALLGTVGRALGLVMVVLQLSASGGTYPIETAPAFFGAINAWLPLPYTVTALRSLIAGGDIGLAHGVLVMLAWLVGALLVTTVVGRLSDHRPAGLDDLVVVAGDDDNHSARPKEAPGRTREAAAAIA